MGAQLAVETIDPRLLPFVWRLAPTPPVVRLMQPALRALISCQMAGVYTMARVDHGSLHPQPDEAGPGQVGRKGGAPRKAAAKGLQAAAAQPAGPYVKLWAADQQLHAKWEAVVEAHGALVHACAGGLGCVHGMEA